jgi:hypothetical protein
LSISVYPPGEGLGELADRFAAPQNMLGTEIFIRKPSVPGFFGGGLSCGCPPPDRVAPPAATLLMRSYSPRPQGRLETHMGGPLPTSAFPLCCFPVGSRHLQRPPPTQIRPYSPRCQTTHQIHVPPVGMRIYEEYLALKINIGPAERKILTLVYI